MKVKVKEGTFFKKEYQKGTEFLPGYSQSSKLPSSHKLYVKEGTEYELLALKPIENNHTVITLKGVNLKGFNTWVVYNPHVELDTGKEEDSFLEKVCEAYKKNGYILDKSPNQVNIVGIEGVNLDGTVNGDVPNYYNDVIGVFTFKGGKAIWLGKYLGTTEPGRGPTVNPMNSKGAARLQFGQYTCYQVGYHKGQYEALVQRGPVTVCRDKNKDYIRTGDKLDTGYFGINLHHGNNSGVSNIGWYSAGCQVVRAVKDLKDLLKIVKADPRYLQNKQYLFRYTLLDGTKI